MPSPNLTPPIALRRSIPKSPTGDAAVVQVARAIAQSQPLTPAQIISGVRYFRANKNGALLGGRMGDRWFRTAYQQWLQQHTDAFNAQQSRDKNGRFAKKSSSRAETLKLLTEKGYQKRLKAIKPGDLEHLLLAGGRSYAELKAEHGKAHADLILEKYLRVAARWEASRSIEEVEAKLEHGLIEQQGTPKQKADLKAYRYFSNTSENLALSQWQQQNPQESATLLDRHAEALRLDQALTHDAIMARGKVLAAGYEKDIAVVAGKSDRYAIQVRRDAAFKLRQKLIGDGISSREAVKLLAKVDHKAIEGKERETTLAAAHEFLMMSGGHGAQTLKKFVKTDPRASANQYNQELNIGSAIRKDTIWHELGHHVEFSDSRIAKAASDWRDRRTTGAPKSLNELTGRSGYDSHEAALPGAYIHPYVGKTYHDGSTEVVSMGMQFFAHPDTMVYLHDKAPDHFHFILGLLKRD